MGTVKGKPYYLRQLIYAVRYEYGYEYLDRTGALINAILREDDGWANVSASPAGTQLHHLQDGVQLSFSKEQFAFSLLKPMDGDPLNVQESSCFLGKVKNISPIIMSEFNISLDQLTRVGSRSIYYLPFEDHQKASDWLLSSEVVTINKSDLFEGALFNPSIYLRWNGDLVNRSVRIDIREQNAQIDFGDGILGVRASQQSKGQREILLKQQKAKHRRRVNPGFFINVDFDFFMENQEIPSALMLDFPENCVKESPIALDKLFDQPRGVK